MQRFCLGGCGTNRPADAQDRDIPLCIISAARAENGSNVTADLTAAGEAGAATIGGYVCVQCQLFTDCGGKCGKTFKFEDLSDFAAPGAGVRLTYRVMQPTEVVALGCGGWSAAAHTL